MHTAAGLKQASAGLLLLTMLALLGHLLKESCQPSMQERLFTPSILGWFENNSIRKTIAYLECVSPELDAAESECVAGLLHTTQLDEGIWWALVTCDAAVYHRVTTVQLGAAACHQCVEERAQIILQETAAGRTAWSGAAASAGCAGSSSCQAARQPRLLLSERPGSLNHYEWPAEITQSQAITDHEVPASRAHGLGAAVTEWAVPGQQRFTGSIPCMHSLPLVQLCANTAHEHTHSPTAILSWQ